MEPIVAGYSGKVSYDQIPELAIPGLLACLFVWGVLKIRLMLRRKRERESKRSPDAP